MQAILKIWPDCWCVWSNSRQLRKNIMGRQQNRESLKAKVIKMLILADLVAIIKPYTKQEVCLGCYQLILKF